MKRIVNESTEEFAVSTERFLKQRAVNIAVDGHYTLSNWYDPQGRLRTFPCRTTRVSPYRMMVDVPVVGKVGDTLTSYFRDFGKLDGSIKDIKPGCFLLELDVSYAVRQRLADKLTWLEEKQKDPEVIDLRKEPRLIPARSHSTLTLADGTIHQCFIIDMSVTGASISAELQPEIGTPLAVGACVGRVVRVFPTGFAVKFVEKQNSNDLDGLILIARPIRSARGAKAAPECEDAAAEPTEGLAFRFRSSRRRAIRVTLAIRQIKVGRSRNGRPPGWLLNRVSRPDTPPRTDSAPPPSWGRFCFCEASPTLETKT